MLSGYGKDSDGPWLYEVYILLGGQKEYLFYPFKEENQNSFEVKLSDCHEKNGI